MSYMDENQQNRTVNGILGVGGIHMIVLTLNECLDFTPKNEMNVERRRYFSLVELVNQKFSATYAVFQY